MRRTPLLIVMAVFLILEAGCHSRSRPCCADSNGSMTISQGGDDIGGALLGVILYVSLQMIFSSGR